MAWAPLTYNPVLFVYLYALQKSCHLWNLLRGCLDSRKCAEVRKWEVLFPTFAVHPNTRKRKWKNPFLFLFPFTQPFSHFQSATVNFVVMQISFAISCLSKQLILWLCKSHLHSNYSPNFIIINFYFNIILWSTFSLSFSHYHQNTKKT